MKYCCEKMKKACDWGDDEKGDRTMMKEEDGFYMTCADCQTHNMDPINFCPFCGVKLNES